MANLKRQTRELWEKKGRAMLVDDVAEALKIMKTDVCQDVGEQLYPFTTQGEYGRFFNVTTIFASKTDSPFWS